ncbi:MAG: DegT/DnrJ/EryC1/StrS family aminotransferase [Candidatus Micrarchaeota archaeon]|nr:DegT/DnrJ/EryC1/StrS family aminotransferase [Candidatus Micrarchaeota archaeon]
MEDGTKFINVSEPDLSKLELKNAIEAVKSGFISGTAGKFIKQFEEEFARFCGAQFAVACNSGTAALQLAIRVADIKAGDEVIVPTFTNIASLLCIVYAGGKPVLVDSRADTWCMDETLVEQKITPRTKAILPVHIYGHPVKMDTIMQIAKKHNLLVIEDAAEAHGATFEEKMVGSFGDLSCFSFYANKIITTGEGGMTLTSSQKFADKMKVLRNLAFQDTVRYLHEDLGYNYRMTNIQAAIGVAQLSRINQFIEKKREMAQWYNKGLKKVKGVTLPVEMPWAKNVYWMYGIVIDEEKFGMSKEMLMQELKKRGIDSRSFFIPMHQQPVFHSMGLFKGESYPVSENIGKNGLYLPSGLTIKKSQVSYICKAIKELSKRKN